MRCPHTCEAVPRERCAICRGEREVKRAPVGGYLPDPMMRIEPGAMDLATTWATPKSPSAKREPRAQTASEQSIKEFFRAIDEGRRLPNPPTKAERVER